VQQADLDTHLRPQPDESDVRAVREDDVPVLASGLAHAFRDDPGFSWVFRNEDRRLGRLEQVFAQLFRRLWLGKADPYTTDGLAGAAVWMPPDRWEPPLSVQLRMLPGLALNAREELLRFVRSFNFLEGKHPHEPHWYLSVLGIDPDLQGRGFGSHLMQPALRRCDQERLPAYLETATERNVALYERHGFRVTEELPLPGGGPPIWLMWRDPA
jgi:ribosomal protein S18 acetylase RimI-like enzyme